MTLGTTALRRAARFASSSFLRLSIFPGGRRPAARPSAGNANRWAIATFRTYKRKLSILHFILQTKENDMFKKLTSQLRVYLAVFVVLWEMAHLAWEQLNDGIKSHHFLAMNEMPAISNWWGLLLLPILAWFLAGSIQRRIDFRSNVKDSNSQVLASIVVGGVASLIFGILLSFFFTNGNENITSYLFFGMLLLALILPIYRA
jgi:hypothetical protein